MAETLRVLIVEDEALLAMQLEAFLEEQGHEVVGVAVNSAQALRLAAEDPARSRARRHPPHRRPTGVEVGRAMAQELGLAVVFITANPKRIPEDFVGAIGVVPKPYTVGGLATALRFLISAVHRPPPPMPGPSSLQLAPAFAERWQG
jgi:DNA-binding LytR/AlgR family response regulator